jgi:hypothetical protein
MSAVENLNKYSFADVQKGFFAVYDILKEDADADSKNFVAQINKNFAGATRNKFQASQFKSMLGFWNKTSVENLFKTWRTFLAPASSFGFTKNKGTKGYSQAFDHLMGAFCAVHCLTMVMPETGHCVEKKGRVKFQDGSIDLTVFAKDVKTFLSGAIQDDATLVAINANPAIVNAIFVLYATEHARKTDSIPTDASIFTNSEVGVKQREAIFGKCEGGGGGGGEVPPARVDTAPTPITAEATAEAVDEFVMGAKNASATSPN